MPFRNSILAGTTLVREAIQSQNFQAGVAGWRITAAGDAEFNEVAVRGQVHAGTATDYVEISPTPQPRVDFSTSHPDQIAPASVRFGDYGSNSFHLYGPDLGDGPDEIRFLAGIVNSLEIIYNSLFQLGHVDGDARLRGGSQWLALDALDRVELNTSRVLVNGVDQGRGLLDFTAITASAAAVTTTETVGITSAVVDFENQRAYRVSVRAWFQSTVAGDIVGSRLRKTNAAGQQYFDLFRSAVINAAGGQASANYEAIIRNVSGATVSAALVVTYFRGSGTGNVFLGGNATNPSWLHIEDIGRAADYAGANNIT